MDLLYNFGIRTYRAAVRLASIKNNKARLMLKGQVQTFDLLRERLDPDGGYIWFHASSLGEFEQARPLIEMLRERKPQSRILLSFFSPSGYEVRKNYDKVDAVCYMPFDLTGNVKQFLDIVKPSMAIFVKYEFWGNYLRELQRRAVPTYIISAIFRPGQIFFRPWGGMFRKMLRCFDTLYVQNEQSRELLATLGITQVQVVGDTRFDRVTAVRNSAREFPLIEEFTRNARFTMVMGSSWQPDEDIVIPFFNEHSEMKLIIAPHEFDKERLLDLMSRIGRKTVLYTHAHTGQTAKCDCLIIDCFGLLSSLYRYGQVAYVGGGFGSGIHNINEAAVYGIPVIFGPNYYKFREAGDLIACEGGFTVSDAAQFSELMKRFLNSPEELHRCGNIASSYIESQLGATERIYNAIFATRG